MKWQAHSCSYWRPGLHQAWLSVALFLEQPTLAWLQLIGMEHVLSSASCWSAGQGRSHPTLQCLRQEHTLKCLSVCLRQCEFNTFLWLQPSRARPGLQSFLTCMSSWAHQWQVQTVSFFWPLWAAHHDPSNAAKARRRLDWWSLSSSCGQQFFQRTPASCLTTSGRYWYDIWHNFFCYIT